MEGTVDIIKISGRVVVGIILSPFLLLGFFIFTLPTFVISGRWEGPREW